ncbi:MAG: 2-keto-4-pentenoate hydratase [Geminicoccaceae bacterium]
MDSRSEAGQALARARIERRQLDMLPGGLPEEEATAYGIQAAAIEAFGQPRCGYKIGATSPEAQAILHTDHPFCAPLFEPDRRSSGATIAEPGYGLLGLEPEFALRLKHDLPARTEAYEVAEVEAAVASVHPAFEVIGLRLPNELFPNALVVTADFGANVGFVAGDGIDNWRNHDLPTIAVTAFVDGKQVASGSAKSVMGHPLNALQWLINHLSTAEQGLEAGAWISTGTCAGVVPIAVGQQAKADFGPFGEVALRLGA